MDFILKVYYVFNFAIFYMFLVNVFIFIAHFVQINLLSYEINFFVTPQKMQFCSYFFKIIEESSTNFKIALLLLLISSLI